MEKLTLKAVRVNKGLSITEAAKELDINVATLSSYENGKTYPDVPMIIKMLNLYDVNFDKINFLCENSIV